MNKKALIFDFDNTLYPVSSIADKIFPPLFNLIADSGEQDNSLEKVKQALMRKPYQVVAATFGFSEALTKKGLQLLKNMTYNDTIEPFPDYVHVKSLPLEKFLVTTGFYKLQLSKIQRMGVEKDFKEIHIVDPEKSSKKEVFASILQRNNFHASEVLVVGDDLESEIKAAQELGIDAVLYDKSNLGFGAPSIKRISDFGQLSEFVLNG